MNKRILKVLFGLLFIGGVAAVLNIYRAAKDVEHSLDNDMEEYDGEFFV